MYVATVCIGPMRRAAVSDGYVARSHSASFALPVELLSTACRIVWLKALRTKETLLPMWNTM